MTLRARLFLLVGGVVSLAVGLVTWTVSVAARTAFESFDRERTAALVAQTRRELSRQGDDVSARVERLIASDAFQRTALEISRRPGDVAPFVSEAATLAAGSSLDFLDLVAEDGTLISSAEWPARFGYRHPFATTAARGPGAAAQGSAFLQTIELPQETALGLMTVRRVTTAGRPLYVAGGRRINQAFLKSLALPAGIRAWFAEDGKEPPAPQLAPLIARVKTARQDAEESVAWPDGRENVNALPLAGANGSVLGVLLLGSSSRELTSLLARIRWSGVAFGAAGVALGLVLSYMLAARVTRPVEQLAGAAREIAAGNWSVRSGVEAASSEVAELATAFDGMAQQLTDQRDRLVQVERVAAWRELARRLAHELKNPLFPLRLTIDNLRRAKPLPPPEFTEVLDESLATLDTGLSNLNTVVQRFSDFSRMPAPEFGRVQPNAVIEQAITLFRPQLAAGDRPPIEVALDLDRSSPAIRADAEQLGRAVQNLLLNAIDAMPRGGRLGIQTRAEGATFRIAVSDTGEGLTAEECTRLFTPYYTTKQHGTGLGLAIVQSVIADHHGKVRVESAPGRGTTFLIELPTEQV